MQNRKSKRHQIAANARWLAAEQRAQAERDSGIPDREPVVDGRQPLSIDLRCVGGPHLTLEPRRGYMAWRQVDASTGAVLRCAALKTLIREIADSLPRQRAPGACHAQQQYSARDEADAAAC